jgi:hypothetical protein
MDSSRRHSEYLALQNREQAARDAAQQRAAAMRDAQARQAYAAQQQQRASASMAPSRRAGGGTGGAGGLGESRYDSATGMKMMDARSVAGTRQPDATGMGMGMSAGSDRSRVPVPRPVPPRVAETAPVIGSDAQFPADSDPLSREHMEATSAPFSTESAAHAALSLVVYALQLMLLVVLASTVFALPGDLRWVWLVIAGHIMLVAAGAALVRAAPNSWAAQNLSTPLFAAHALLSLVFLSMTAYRIVTLYRAETLGDAVLGRPVREGERKRDFEYGSERRTRKRARTRLTATRSIRLR